MKRRFLEISSGQGPDECRLLVRKLGGRLAAELRGCGVAVQPVGGGEDDTLPRSLLFELDGPGIDAALGPWLGTILWIAPSPFRSSCRRRNWFAGVRLFEADPELCFDASEVELLVSRSGGPGGQHVNTSNTRVQLRHRPTGITVTACEERSQHRNRALALARLAARIAGRNAAGRNGMQADLWNGHRELVRGNPVKTFRGDEL